MFVYLLKVTFKMNKHLIKNSETFTVSKTLFDSKMTSDIYFTFLFYSKIGFLISSFIATCLTTPYLFSNNNNLKQKLLTLGDNLFS